MKFFIYLLCLSEFLLATGCAPMRAQKTPAAPAPGPEPQIYHTRDEVLQAIQQAREDLKNADTSDLIAVSLEVLKQKGAERTLEERRVLRVLRKIETRGRSSFTEAKKFILKEDGLCSGAHDSQSLAAGTQSDLDGSICISVFGLMRSPSVFLRFDIVPLILHQAAHLHGYGEKEAKTIQTYFIKSLPNFWQARDDEAKKEFLRRVWTEYIRIWPRLLHNGPITASYVSRISFMAYYLDEIKIPNSLLRGLDQKQPEAVLYLRKLDQVKENIRVFAEDVNGDLKAEKTEVLEKHLRHQRRLSREVVDLYLQLHAYMRSVPNSDEVSLELDQIDWATEVESLREPKGRYYSLLCQKTTKSEPPETSRDEVMRMGASVYVKRCEN